MKVQNFSVTKKPYLFQKSKTLITEIFQNFWTRVNFSTVFLLTQQKILNIKKWIKTFVVLQLTFFFLHCLIRRFCSLENCCLRFFCNKIISSQQLLVCCRVETFVVVVVVVLVVVVVVVVGGVVVVVVVDVVSVEVIVNSIVVYSVVVGSSSSS